MKIDIYRNEERFMIVPEVLSDFLERIKEICSEQVFSEKGITRTIYLNDDEYSLPWGYSVKLRAFLKDFSEIAEIVPDELYRLDIKFEPTPGTDEREKIQQTLPLATAIEAAKQHFKDNFQTEVDLRPYAVVEYRRFHFANQQDLPLRLTVDQEMRYGFFEKKEKTRAIWLDSENLVRIEIKIDSAFRNSPEYLRILEILESLGALPVISKREQAYTFIARKLRDYGSKIYRDFPDYELEAKFLVNHQNPALLLKEIKDYFRKGVGDFVVSDDYPFTQEEASVNHYWSRVDEEDRTVDGLKTLFSGRSIRAVYKEKVKFDIWQGGTLKRKEIKIPHFLFTPDLYRACFEEWQAKTGKLDYVGYLLRSRRAIWPQKNKTGRVYHISLDRCVSFDGRVLWQLEIEYTGRKTPPLPEENPVQIEVEINGDIGEISENVLKIASSHLIPTRLTKFDWLAKI